MKLRHVYFGLLLILCGVLLANSLHAGIHYRYQISADRVLDYTVSQHGVRMQVSRNNKSNVVIYSRERDALITLQPQTKSAVVMNREEIERMTERVKQAYQKYQEQMKKMREKMKNMPESRRKMMEDMMKKKMGSMGSMEKPEPVRQSEVHVKKNVTWNDLPAREVVFTLEGDTIGDGVMLNSPPVEIDEASRQSLDSFQSLLKEIMKMAQASSQKLNMNNVKSWPDHLMGSNQLQIAEFSGPGQSLKLTEWSSVSPPKNKFEVPEGYTEQNPASSMKQGVPRSGSSAYGQRR